MTILEIHKVLLERKFTINMRLYEQDESMAHFTIGRYDFDGLFIHANAYLPMNETTNPALYGKFMKEGAEAVEKFIIDRKNQNIASCNHKMVDVDGKQKCNKCRADFGTKLTINLMDN